MNETSQHIRAAPRTQAVHARADRATRAPRGFWLGLSALFVGFALPLSDLVRFAAHSDLYSYILLIPLISGYLAWKDRAALLLPDTRAPRLALPLLIGGTGLAIVNALWPAPHVEDHLAYHVIALTLTLAGAVAGLRGRSTLRAFAFPLGFLLFAAPVPVAVLESVETFMQHGSATIAGYLFEAAGTPVFHDGLSFQLPGILLHVARECSGIRSTIVLLIVSTLTAHAFLRGTLSRSLIVAAIVPLALLRNGLRIFAVGELCVRYGPQMIDSYLHRRGGPIFFALSLVPFFLLVFLLQACDRRAAAGSAARPRA